MPVLKADRVPRRKFPERLVARSFRINRLRPEKISMPVVAPEETLSGTRTVRGVPGHSAAGDPGRAIRIIRLSRPRATGQDTRTTPSPRMAGLTMAIEPLAVGVCSWSLQVTSVPELKGF